MIKHCLSPCVTITAAKADNDYKIPDKFQDGYFVLQHENKESDYLINPTIHFFLQKFLLPHTLYEVIEGIKIELNTYSPELDETCKTFFQFLVRKKILVEEGTEKINVSNDPFFNTGDTIDDMLVENILSLRGYVDIYQTIEKNTGAKYAVKCTNRKKMKDEYSFTVALAELEREYLLLKRASHIPNICKVISFVKKAPELAYICLEFINGKSLNSHLKKAINITPEDVLQIMEGILQPFAALHNSKIIHGDIHSSNIIVSENNVVKIIDLGFSRIAELEKDQLIKHGGVTFYMPPERINTTSVKKFAKAPDLRSDVYQIGLLLYLTLFNSLPFDGFIWEELAENIQSTAVSFPQTTITGEESDEKMTNIIAKCLSKEPTDRYVNAGAVYDDFKNNVLAKKALVAN